MCTELGNDKYMNEYVEEAGNTSLCKLDGTGCDEKSKAYIEKMQQKTQADHEKQLKRLEGMDEKSMAPDLGAWLVKRKKILKLLLAAGGSSEEL